MDIQETKCSWLSVTAWEYSNDEQRKLLENCYGTEKNSDILKVKALFDQLNLAEKFRCWDERVMNEAHDLFRSSSDAGLKEVFGLFLSKYLQDPRRGVPRPAKL
jgi:geranylgeranyl pyrophosphate synthase